jgi:hypothetical protein
MTRIALRQLLDRIAGMNAHEAVNDPAALVQQDLEEAR